MQYAEMENTFLVSLSQLSALRRQMDIIANNLANANTDSFKSEQPVFEQYISPEAKGGSAAPDVMFTIDSGVVRDMQQGSIIHTGNKLDAGLGGEGFYAVQRDDGIAYTRDGHFKLSSKGEIITADGFKILDSQSKPIVLPQGTGIPDISGDGSISAGGIPLQRLGVFKFENPAALEKAGSNLYTTDEQAIPVPPADVSIIQGSIEASNVQPVVEMTRMIDVMRKYQSASQLVDTGDDLTRKAIDQLSTIR